MGYFSSRTFGCRMHESTIKGCRFLTMENEGLRILVLLDKGGDIISFLHKRSDTECLWRSPGGLDLLDRRWSRDENYVGGWFGLFPNAGPSCSLVGNPIPQYGDTRLLQWNMTVLTDTASCISVQISVRSFLLPLDLTRTLTLQAGHAKLQIAECAVNTGSECVAFTWGHHPNLGSPFLDESCRIDMNASTIYRLVNPPDGPSHLKAVGEWPWIPMDEGLVDATHIPPTHEKCNDIVYLKNVDGRFHVMNESLGLDFLMEWDMSTFSNMLLWRGFDGSRYDSVFGRLYILCPLIMSSTRPAITDAIVDGDALRLEPGGRRETWVSASITEN